MENLNWKLIPNSTYAISDCGKVKRISHKKLHNINKTWYTTKDTILKASNNSTKKYWRILIHYIDGTKTREAIHRLVAKAFVPNIDNKPDINHKDGDKNNNHYTNLEWVTNLENMNHRYTKLKYFGGVKGSKCNFSKLKEEDVYDIANRIKSGETYNSIILDYPICKSTLSELKSGRSWRHLNLFPYRKRKSEKYDKS